MTTLDTRLLAAHSRGDKHALVALYCEAASSADTEDATGFYLTHAYVFALDCGHPDADSLRKRLRDMGRDA